MTAEELVSHFNHTFGYNPWPEIFKVDHETYANCCQHIFERKAEPTEFHNLDIAKVALGPHHGLMFKNVELILKK